MIIIIIIIIIMITRPSLTGGTSGTESMVPLPGAGPRRGGAESSPRLIIYIYIYIYIYIEIDR